MLILSAITMCFSCSKDEEEPKNPLKGTLWSYHEVCYYEGTIISECTRYIKFADNTKVIIWESEGFEPRWVGSYEINGNTVDFQNLRDLFRDVYYEDATFTSDSLKVRYFTNAGRTDGPYYAIYKRE